MRLLAVPVVFALLLLGGIKLLGLDHAARRGSSAHEPRDAPAAPGASRAKSDADVRAVISYWSGRIGRDVQAVHRTGRRGDIDRFDDAARRLRADCLRARAAVAAQPATTERGLQAKRLAAHGFLLFARAGRQLDLAVTTGLPARRSSST